jgi:hypothetical protein
MVAEQAADLVFAQMICMWFVKNGPVDRQASRSSHPGRDRLLA